MAQSTSAAAVQAKWLRTRAAAPTSGHCRMPPCLPHKADRICRQLWAPACPAPPVPFPSYRAVPSASLHAARRVGGRRRPHPVPRITSPPAPRKALSRRRSPGRSPRRAPRASVRAFRCLCVASPGSVRTRARGRRDPPMRAAAQGGKVATSGRRPASSAGCCLGGAPGAVPGAAASIVVPGGRAGLRDGHRQPRSVGATPARCCSAGRPPP